MYIELCSFQIELSDAHSDLWPWTEYYIRYYAIDIDIQVYKLHYGGGRIYSPISDSKGNYAAVGIIGLCLQTNLSFDRITLWDSLSRVDRTRIFFPGGTGPFLKNISF